MIISYAQMLKEEGINFQQNLLVEANDISDVCAYMAYLQLSLLGIPARVHCGNILTLEDRFVLATPLFYMNYYKFRNFYIKKEEQQDEPITKEIANIQYEFKDTIQCGNTQISFW